MLYDLVISNGLVVDGSGMPAFATVGIVQRVGQPTGRLPGRVWRGPMPPPAPRRA